MERTDSLLSRNCGGEGGAPGKRWASLHRWVYVAAALGCWHFFWSLKKDKVEALQYVAVLAVLLAWRVVLWAMKRRELAGA